MPPLTKAKYIQQWLREGARDAQNQTSSQPFPFDKCVAALDSLGVKTDYDIVLQSDVLEQTPVALHRYIRMLRMVVLEHFACEGHTADDLCSSNSPPPQQQQSVCIASGIQGLDSLLGGGVHAGQITEICGGSGSGKSQIAIEFAAEHLAPRPSRATVTSTEDVTCANKVYYLQSSPLSIWRIEQALKRRLESRCPASVRDSLFRQAMERLQVVDCSDMDALLTFLYKYADARESACSLPSNSQTSAAASTDLLVIDSIRPLVISAIQLDNDAHVSVHAVKTALRRITSVHSAAATAVFVVNGVSQRDQSKFGAGANSSSHSSLAEVQPSLGASWSLVSHVQLYVHPNTPPHRDAETRDNKSSHSISAVILRSPHSCADSRAVFTLTA
ncbi:P-loop containing nucleoside triphosphate hydrolase protein [Martensiomyces pterosporus]|nr:P-loop containing nucleoside triphosphate hydrolase protein [Martensiomyces pterosporus]